MFVSENNARTLAPFDLPAEENVYKKDPIDNRTVFDANGIAFAPNYSLHFRGPALLSSVSPVRWRSRFYGNVNVARLPFTGTETALCTVLKNIIQFQFRSRAWLKNRRFSRGTVNVTARGFQNRIERSPAYKNYRARRSIRI